MRSRSLMTAGLLGAVVLVLGAVLAVRLMPASGSDGTVEPVVITPAGSSASPTPAPEEPSATPPTTPAPTEPSQVKPTPRSVDDDDDDDDDSPGDDDERDDPDDD